MDLWTVTVKFTLHPSQVFTPKCIPLAMSPHTLHRTWPSAGWTVSGFSANTGNIHIFFANFYNSSFGFETFSEVCMFEFRIVELFTTQCRLLTTLKKKALKNTVGKGENAGNQVFLLFPQCFLLYQREKSSFWKRWICRLHVLPIWSHPRFCRLVKS